MDIVAGSGNDEFYTPAHAVAPIAKYIPTDAIVWCPFDTEQSNFVQIFRDRGNEVIASHIADSLNFFSYEPDSYDYIVSNPPYSNKADVFERLFALRRPFAMLVGVVGLFESKRRFQLFSQNKFEIMYLSKRIAYFKSYEEPKPSLNPPFSSVYLTSGVLPRQIVFETI